MEKKKPDCELTTIKRIEKQLEGFSTEVQRRVIHYVIDRINSRQMDMNREDLKKRKEENRFIDPSLETSPTGMHRDHFQGIPENSYHVEHDHCPPGLKTRLGI